MTAIKLLACVGLIVGTFLLFGIKPAEFTEGLFEHFLHPRKSIREEIRESSGKKKISYLRKEISEAQEILQMTGRGQRFSAVCALALGLFCAGDRKSVVVGKSGGRWV